VIDPLDWRSLLVLGVVIFLIRPISLQVSAVGSNLTRVDGSITEDHFHPQPGWMLLSLVAEVTSEERAPEEEIGRFSDWEMRDRVGTTIT